MHSKRKILIINHWDDTFSHYESYIDHTQYDVAYLVNQVGYRVVDQALAKAVEVVDDLSNFTMVLAAAKRLDAILGGITNVIALSEFDLEVAAFVREQLHVSGMWPHQVTKYRDKVAMKCAVERQGIKVPAFMSIACLEDVSQFAGQYGYPLIIKPKKGASSQGIIKLQREDCIEQIVQNILFQDYECEQYIAGKIYHVDGLIEKGVLRFISVSRYMNTCLDFNHGLPLGSVNIDDSELKRIFTDFTVHVLKALDLFSGAFHLEVIQNDSGELYFLEIGARVGGGEIPFLMKQLHGIDLMEAWCKIELGENLADLHMNRVGGFLMIPKPSITPCRVLSCHPLKDKIEGLCYEKIPEVGHIFHDNQGYEAISGQFHFTAPSTDLVEQAILKTIQSFSMVTETVDML